MVGFCTMVRCVLVHFVVGGFRRVSCCGIVGRVWLFIASLRLVIALVVGLVVSSLPLLIVGGRLVGMVLLCEHLSQRSGWSGGGGLQKLYW